MSEVIVVTSGKGGVGKTTTSANVGTGLASLGKKVVLIDTDIGLRNLDVVMGLENRIVYNLVDVVEGNCRIKQALIKDKRYPSLYLMPSAQTRDKSSVNPGQMIKMIAALKEQFDYILNVQSQVKAVRKRRLERRLKKLGYKSIEDSLEMLKEHSIYCDFDDILQELESYEDYIEISGFF